MFSIYLACDKNVVYVQHQSIIRDGESFEPFLIFHTCLRNGIWWFSLQRALRIFLHDFGFVECFLTYLKEQTLIAVGILTWMRAAVLQNSNPKPFAMRLHPIHMTSWKFEMEQFLTIQRWVNVFKSLLRFLQTLVLIEKCVELAKFWTSFWQIYAVKLWNTFRNRWDFLSRTIWLITD